MVNRFRETLSRWRRLAAARQVFVGLGLVLADPILRALLGSFVDLSPLLSPRQDFQTGHALFMTLIFFVLRLAGLVVGPTLIMLGLFDLVSKRVRRRSNSPLNPTEP